MTALVLSLEQDVLLPTSVMLNFRGTVLQAPIKENQNCAV